MKKYIIEIFALDRFDHLYVYHRSYCDTRDECLMVYRKTFGNFSSNCCTLCGYNIYVLLEDSTPDDSYFENDFS